MSPCPAARDSGFVFAPTDEPRRRWTRSSFWWGLAIVLLSPLAPIAALAFAIRLIFRCGKTPTQEGSVGSATDETAHNSTEYPHALDSAVYWIGHGNVLERATGAAGTFFDPNRPSVVYTHGCGPPPHRNTIRPSMRRPHRIARLSGAHRGLAHQVSRGRVLGAWVLLFCRVAL